MIIDMELYLKEKEKELNKREMEIDEKEMKIIENAGIKMKKFLNV